MDRLSRHAPLAFSRAKFSNFQSFSVADTDLQVRGSPGHTDSEIKGEGGGGGRGGEGGRSQKNFIRPFGPQFGLKVRRIKPPGPLPWIRHWFLNAYHAFYNPRQSSLDISMCFVISRNTTIISNGNKIVPPPPPILVQSCFGLKAHVCISGVTANKIGTREGGNGFSFCDGKLFGQDECKK